MPRQIATIHTATKARIKVTIVLSFSTASPTDMIPATMTRVSSAIGRLTNFLVFVSILSPHRRHAVSNFTNNSGICNPFLIDNAFLILSFYNLRISFCCRPVAAGAGCHHFHDVICLQFYVSRLWIV